MIFLYGLFKWLVLSILFWFWIKSLIFLIGVVVVLEMMVVVLLRAKFFAKESFLEDICKEKKKKNIIRMILKV